MKASWDQAAYGVGHRQKESKCKDLRQEVVSCIGKPGEDLSG
jgi:hypothetical protein